MRVLVTGGAGYIGSVLVPMLLEGNNVTVIDSFLYGMNSLSQCAINPRFKVEKVDCRDKNAVRPYLKHADVVIPLAGLVGAPLCDLNPVDAELINLRAPLDLISMLSKHQRILMPTTESMYGKNVEVCTENTKLLGLSTYALHKIEVEKALLGHPNSTSLRLATVFGMSSRMRLDLLINDFTWRALKDRALCVFEAKYRRTCVHVHDVARAFLHALDKDLRGVFNVGSVTLSKWELCEELKKFVPNFHYVEIKHGTDPDGRDYVVSDTKIRATGYTPIISLHDGIEELLKGYRMLSNNIYGNV